MGRRAVGRTIKGGQPSRRRYRHSGGEEAPTVTTRPAEDASAAPPCWDGSDDAPWYVTLADDDWRFASSR